MSKLVEKRNELDAKRKALRAIFAEAGEDMDLEKVTSITGTTAEKAAEIRRLNDELTAIGKEVEDLKAAEDARKGLADADDILDGKGTPPPQPNGERRIKTIGELFTESAALKDYKGGGIGPVATLDVDLKVLMTTTAGWAPEALRTGRLVEDEQRPIQVLDLIPPGTTDQAAVVYMEETTFTSGAAEVAEGGAYGEAALALTERTSTVRKIAVFLPVTDEQLEDVAGIQSYINNRLSFMLRQRLDGQVLVGSGVAPNLTGILNVAGIQTQAKGADPVPDAVFKAMTLVRVTGRAEPNAVVFHPNDWQDIRLLRTADGIYIWGSPSEAGPERIWGLRVVATSAETENTGLVGDFATHCQLYSRRGIEVQVSNSHSTYFVEGKQAIRADLRVAFPVYRPTAFCTVTGI